MVHYRSLYDGSDFLFAFDLLGKDQTVTIEKVVAGEVSGEKGRKSKKPIVSFVGAKKRLALNKTNGKTIAAMYGTDTEQWTGKRVTLFPTTTDFGGETVECIRCRPNRPPEPRNTGKGATVEPDPHGDGPPPDGAA